MFKSLDTFELIGAFRPQKSGSMDRIAKWKKLNVSIGKFALIKDNKKFLKTKCTYRKVGEDIILKHIASHLRFILLLLVRYVSTYLSREHFITFQLFIFLYQCRFWIWNTWLFILVTIHSLYPWLSYVQISIYKLISSGKSFKRHWLYFTTKNGTHMHVNCN